MKAVVLGVLVASRWVVAQPAFQPERGSFDDCKERRIGLTAAAMQVADLNERGQLLAAMPVCGRFETGETLVVEREPPPKPDTSPFSPHLELAARTGIAATLVMSTHELAPAGKGPFVDVELGYRWRREYSASLFANYSHFSDNDVAEVTGFYTTSIVTVTDNNYAFGGRINRHVGSFWVGGGLGVQIESETSFHDFNITRTLRNVDGYVGYRLGTSRYLDAELLVILSEAGHAFDTNRELLSGQFAVGLKL